MLSVQRRFRACLDLDSGLPVPKKEEHSQCIGPLVEERPCPDAEVCRGNGVCPRGRNGLESELRSLPKLFISEQSLAAAFVKLQLRSEAAVEGI